ncbi:triphosphoribosyl-dephospho-CoA synthase MdcB [Asaia prunellae]|uniref:triphosphoribosyl-dephospho-CoA synthase MdcB n=1 Tax=Asaia prunellae TaxID=610245 RepID=UPI00046E937B|nr:triphosphoribosyl-dephospho-CoA synthase MdcB [Asaia prunellae]
MMVSVPGSSASPRSPDIIAELARKALLQEVVSYPKPGLVSRVDGGSHGDMDYQSFTASIDAIVPFFRQMAAIGAADQGFRALQQVGIAAEMAMLRATGGVNTHRGAIFGVGLLCAASGTGASDLGACIAMRWGKEILRHAPVSDSHGTKVREKYGIGGARQEAATGFPTLYAVGLPVLHQARTITSDQDACSLQVLMSFISRMEDTTLFHRGGRAGAQWAARTARLFLDRGGIRDPDWYENAVTLHHAFVAKNLSPGGCADLLAMTLFVDALHSDPSSGERS